LTKICILCLAKWTRYFIKRATRAHSSSLIALRFSCIVFKQCAGHLGNMIIKFPLPNNVLSKAFGAGSQTFDKGTALTIIMNALAQTQRRCSGACVLRVSQRARAEENSTHSYNIPRHKEGESAPGDESDLGSDNLN
jgi:hypothetical protein